MKILKYIFSLSVVLLALTTCSDDQKDINFSTSVEAPSELAMLFQVTQDNTGVVSITQTAQGAVEFDIHFGDDTSDPVNFTNGQSTTHTYVEGTYTVSAVAYGVTGLETTLEQELVISFQSPSNLEVVIENDSAISKRVNITASADFAVSFDVTAPGTTEETPSPVTANIGDTVFIDFTESGTYTITVEVMGAAIETTVYTEDFEVTAIEAPVASAPTPPTRADEDVISIFSSVYSDLPGTNYFPDWGQGGQGSGWNLYDLAGDTMLQYINLSYQGISLADGTSVDVSTMEYLHIDVWTANSVTDIETSLINGVDGASTETPIVTSLTADNWTSIDIPVSAYTDLGQVVTDIFQLKFVGTPWAAGTVFIDNIYFYKSPSGPSPLEGTWRMLPEAGALGVGPTQGAINWWSNSTDDVNVRSCFFDDTFVFNGGNFSNVVGSDTWLEPWQGVDPEACGAPIAPHNGSSPATYVYDESAGTLTVSGLGAYVGLAKAHNGGEDGLPADNTITYLVESLDANNMVLDIEAGSGVWWRFRLTKDAVQTTPVDGTWVITPDAGSLGVGPTQGATNWWSNSADDVSLRSCFFDDTFVFSGGNFSNVLGSETWLEPWQGFDPEACGAPMAPHDGSSPATYVYDESAGTLTVSGSGAYVGLAKAHNGGEDGLPANNTITYLVDSLDANTMVLDIEAGSGVWWRFSLTKI